MLTIQLNPQLHHTVHMLKNVDLRKDASVLLAKLSLSHEESSAMVRTFSRNTSKKEPQEPSYSWWD
jgi:hypothetical protein